MLSPSPPEPLVLKGGIVVDGTGGRRYRADVRVEDGRITQIGHIEPPEAGITYDVSGSLLCPGFVDTHSHDDLALLFDPCMSPKLMQGITTVVTGNCGIGVAPGSRELSAQLSSQYAAILGYKPIASYTSFDDYLGALSTSRAAINQVTLVPHAALRYAAMEQPKGPATSEEVAAMRQMLDVALSSGAAGMSSGLVYEPGLGASTSELVMLGTVLADHNAVYATHIRDEGARLLPSINEAISISRDAGCALHISHLKATGMKSQERMLEALDLIHCAREKQIDVTFDVYPYAAGATSLEAGVRADSDRLPGSRSNVRIISAPGHTEFEGRWLADIADDWGQTLEAAANEIVRRCPGCRVVVHMMDPISVRAAVGDSLSMIGTDGLPDPNGRTHPRHFGSFPRVLDEYCEPNGGMNLEEAIKKMTYNAAQRFRLGDRGLVRVGWAADLVIFTPGQVKDRATFEVPAIGPTGIDFVVVNGAVAVRGGESTASTSGQTMRVE